MVTDFEQFNSYHIAALLAAFIIGLLFILIGKKASSREERRKVSMIFALVIVLIRSVRYVMDIFFGVFEWTDLVSLHVCHIDLILLVICLIRPNKWMYHFCYLVGIPMGLAVALFPGTNHPAPGLARAVLFIMSHMMLVMGALYLASVLRLKLDFKLFAGIVGMGSLLLIPLYFVNKIISANYLYIMKAPAGTVIEQLAGIFGWPGYVAVMDLLAVTLMLLMFLIGKLITGNEMIGGNRERQGTSAEM